MTSKTALLSRFPAAVAALLAMLVLPPVVDRCLAENAQISKRRQAEKLDFSDSEIAVGFFKIAFGAELQLDGTKDRIRKFREPVRIYVERLSGPSRMSALIAVAADIKAHVPGLDIQITGDRKAANVLVATVREKEFGRTIAKRFGAEKAEQISKSLTPVCLSGIAKDETYTIRHAEVFLPADVSDFTFYDCAYEELLQSLGPINDTDTVPWTMFNDEVQMGFFDRYDQYILNILYDPRILPGMTKAEVTALLPEIMSSVRARVAAFNDPARSRQSLNAVPLDPSP